MNHIIYGGSFDPITNGHLWMIREGAKMCSTLTIAVGENSSKKYMFDVGTRIRLIKESVADLPNVKVTFFTGEFLVDYAMELGATHVLRGIRNETDFGFERDMNAFNSAINQKISTLFLLPPPLLTAVSSSAIKSLIGNRGWLYATRQYVPESVYQEFAIKYLNNFFGDGDFRGLTKDVLPHYAEHHRHYHTITHIADCLEELSAFENSPEAVKYLSPFTRPCLILAILFHDIVYDTHASDNEERSVDKFKKIWSNEPVDAAIDYTSELILSTKTHKPTNPTGPLMLDIDLSILGKSPEEFNRYDENIRKEYAWVPEPLYSQKRAEIMKAFYNRGRLFHTDFFYNKYEKQAKENLKKFA